MFYVVTLNSKRMGPQYATLEDLMHLYAAWGVEEVSLCACVYLSVGGVY